MAFRDFLNEETSKMNKIVKKYDLTKDFNIDSNFNKDKVEDIWRDSYADSGDELGNAELKTILTAAEFSHDVAQEAVHILNRLFTLTHQMEKLQHFLSNVENSSSAWNKNAIKYIKEIEQEFKNKVLDMCSHVCSDMGMNSKRK